MSVYNAPIDETLFALDAVGDLDDVLALDAFDHVDRDLVDSLIAESGRFVNEVLAPLHRVGDTEGVGFDGETVTTAPGWRDAYERYREAGWAVLSVVPEHGGGGIPRVVANCTDIFTNGANMAFAQCPTLGNGAIESVLHHGSAELQEAFLPNLLDGSWTGTMNLTEPEAGSDVGALRCRAERQPDGTYRIHGSKIFITYGDHDLAENIVHLVLARTPDAPPGTKGISCFIVPKLLDVGKPEQRLNDVRTVSIEHKLGTHASPTCVLSFGEQDGAVGYLIGEENHGMRYMFTMMNNARVAVGSQAVGIADRAYQGAVDYARERHQGRAFGAAPGESSPIIDHADVRRMLLDMRVRLDAMRGLIALNSAALDFAAAGADDEQRNRGDDRAAILTPVSKGWCTDRAVELTSIAMQIFGGMGYIEESGIPQLYRDARITPIYEGTNGIQALDLLSRKLPLRGGEAFAELLAEVEADATRLGDTDDLVGLSNAMIDGVSQVRSAAQWLLGSLADNPVEAMAGATPFLTGVGTLLGGHVHVRLASEAMKRLESDPDDRLAATKLVGARYYGEQVLPTVSGIMPSVKAGSETLFAIDAMDW